MTFCEPPWHLPCGPHPSLCEKRANAPKRSRQTDRVTKWQTRGDSLLPSISYVSTLYHLPIEQISFTYRFRIVSASVSENDRRTIREQYGIDTESIRDQYGIDTRTIGCDSWQMLYARSLTFPLLCVWIIFYITVACCALPFIQQWLIHHSPRRSSYTKITPRPAECKSISMN